MTQVPLAPPPRGNDDQTDRWLWLLWRRLTQAGQILWQTIDFTSSNLTDIFTRNHVDLQNHNTTDYYHLTQADHGELTRGDVTSLHLHTHNGQDGIQGGALIGAFSDAFSSSFYLLSASEAYHLTDAEYDEVLRSNNVASVSANTNLDDTYRTIVVTATGKTMTLPAASTARIGKDWTVILGTVGYTDITRDGSDTLVLPETATTIRIDNKGASVTLRCLTASSWGIA